jgi:hypothetical protein
VIANDMQMLDSKQAGAPATEENEPFLPAE